MTITPMVAAIAVRSPRTSSSHSNSGQRKSFATITAQMRSGVARPPARQRQASAIARAKSAVIEAVWMQFSTGADANATP